jgi:hypothetical protein
MALKHDQDGFLIGIRIDLGDEALSLWRGIRRDVSAIRNTLTAGLSESQRTNLRILLARLTDQGGRVPTATPSPARRETALKRTRDAMGRFAREQRRTVTAAPAARPAAAPVSPNRQTGGALGLLGGALARVGAPVHLPTITPSPARRESFVAESPHSKPPQPPSASALSAVQAASETVAVEKITNPAATKRRTTAFPALTPRERDARGRFTGGATNETSSGGSASRVLGQAANTLSQTAETLTRTLGDASDIDPTLKAASELAGLASSVKETVSPVVSRVFGLGRSPKERQEGWLKKIWKTVTLQRSEESAYRKAEMRVLKDIEKKPDVGASGAPGGGVLSLLGKIPGLGLLGRLLGKIPGMGKAGAILGGAAAGALGVGGKLLRGAGSLGKGLLRRIPILGALFAASESAFAESDDGLTRQQKNQTHGRAWGTAAGALAGGALGAFAGPVGMAIGSVLGGWLGGAGGELIGSKVEGWMEALESYDLPGKIESAWTATVDAFKSLPDRAMDTWNAAVEPFKALPEKAMDAWEAVTDQLSAGWEAFTGFLKDKFGIDLPELGRKTAHVAAQVADAVRENAGIANKAIKEATGIDIGANAKKAAASTVDFASRNVIEPAAEGAKAFKDGAGKAWNAVTATVSGAWEGAKKIPTKVADRWNDAKGYIVGAAEKAGVDPGILAKIANYESGGFNSEARPIAKDPGKNRKRQFDGTMAMSTAHGYGQFLDDTWTTYINKYGAKYGIEGAGNLSKEEAARYRHDKAIQAAMLAEFTRENVARGRALGGTDDDANVYALHNLGSGDGPKLLKALKTNPDMPVSALLSGQVISGNKDLYGDGSISVGEAYRRMGDRMRRGEAFAASARAMTASPKLASAPSMPTVSPAPATVPAAPKAISAPPVPPPPAEAALFPLTRGGNPAATITVNQAPPLVGQDVSDRKIAHIASGGIAGGWG